MAHEEGSLHSIGAVLGNDVAIKAYREKKLPYPDGTIIAALHYQTRAVRGKQPNLRPAAVFRSRAPTKFSLWSRTQPSTPRRAAGGSGTSQDGKPGAEA